MQLALFVTHRRLATYNWRKDPHALRLGHMELALTLMRGK